MKKLLAITAISSALLLASTAHADSITFVDSSSDGSHISFPGWSDGGFGDEVGTPKIESMVVDWSVNGSGDKILDTVTINLHSSTGIQSFDSLFINNDYMPESDGSLSSDWDSWDYFVHSGGSENAGNSSGTVPGNGLYSVSDPYTYTLNTSGGRVGHANGIDAGSLTELESGFSRTHATGSYEVVYDFTTLSTEIELGDSFAFAYSPWCANDVIWGTHSTDPVPEPATMLLFGSGLVGLAGLRRKIQK